MAKINFKYVWWYYPALFAVCFIQALGVTPYKLPSEGLPMWPFRLFMFYIGVDAFLRNRNKCKPMTNYLVYSLLSIFIVLILGIPISLYFMAVAFYIIPILFFYVGLDNRDCSNNFYKYTFWGIIVMFLIGMYLYIMPPGWYQQACVLRWESNWYYEGLSTDFDYLAENMRFQSFMLSSYSTQYYGLFAMAFSMYCLLKAQNSRDKIIFTCTSALVLIVLVLSMQRAGIMSALAMVIVFYFVDRKKRKNTNILILTIGICATILFVYLAASDVGAMLIERLSSMNMGALDERTSQTTGALQSFNNAILGTGIGTGGTGAKRAGLPSVADANYTKIFMEQGIVGCILFATFIFSTGRRILKYFKVYAAEGAFMASILVCMIGSNTLDFSLYIPPFWYAMGRVWNKDYLKQQINNQDHI